MRKESWEMLTKKEAKCSDVMTALNPTTGTKAANNVPKTTCIEKAIIRNQKCHFEVDRTDLMSRP